MTKTHRILISLSLALAASAGQAQFSDSYNFLKAVRDRDGTEVTKALEKPGTVIVDTHDSSTGETALHIVTRDRDLTWLRYLLAHGAKPDARDNRGETPLLIAAQIDFIEGVTALLAYDAPVDQANNRGETALIRAVQVRNLAMVKLLLENGANPDKTDHSVGKSARDYARADTRTPALLKIIEEAKVNGKKPRQGPSL